MASICEICTNTFNDGDRQSVVLPCGHDYCLTCLANLEAKKVDKCPSCRRTWKDLDLQRLPAISCVKIVLKMEAEHNDESLKKSRQEDYLCKKHKLPFDFWVKDLKTYFCKRCAAENRNICFELIEDCIPDIRTGLSLEVLTVEKKIKKDLELLEEKKTQLMKVKVNALKFAELVNSFRDKIGAQVEQIDASILKANRATNIAKEVEKNIVNVKSEADINFILESEETLQQFMKTSSIPVEDYMPTLLDEIICSYMKVSDLPDIHSTTKTSFINTLINDTGTSWSQKTKSDGSAGSSLMDEPRNATYRSMEQAMSMDYHNGAKTLLTLVGDSNELQLLVQNNEQYGPSETSNCSMIKVHFKDSFLKPMDVQRDHLSLKMVTADKRLCLTEFYGHLDAEGIAELPKSIRVPLNNLRIWPKLECLKVSMDSKILLHDLKPLPDIPEKDIGIPYLTDDLVDNVKPAINSLMPKRRFRWFVLPKCQLTTDGVRRLQKQMLGILLSIGVIIEFSDRLMPDTKTQADIKTEFLNNLGYMVFFDCNGSLIRNTF